jgi:hypothetical protein
MTPNPDTTPCIDSGSGTDPDPDQDPDHDHDPDPDSFRTRTLTSSIILSSLCMQYFFDYKKPRNRVHRVGSEPVSPGSSWLKLHNLKFVTFILLFTTQRFLNVRFLIIEEVM